MVLNEVKRVREAYKKSKTTYAVVLDNEHLLFSGQESYLIWDDEHEIVTCIRANNTNSQPYKPVEVVSAQYESIQGFKTNADIDSLKELLNGLSIKESIQTDIVDGLSNVFKSHYATPTSEGTNPTGAITIGNR